MFAELLARSCFSFLRGASQPEEHVTAAKERGLDAIAIADRMGLYGSVRAHAQARECDMRIITGAELVLDPEELGRVAPRKKKTQTANEARLLALSDAPSVVLLAQDHAGYSNLCHLLTQSHANQLKKEGALRLEWLAQHHAGLIALVPSPRDPDGPDSAPDILLSTLRDVFGDRAFLAAHRHLDSFDRARLLRVAEQAERFALPVIASARPVFHHRSRKPLADVLCCIREGITLDRAGTALDANGEAFLRSELEMQKLFREHLDWVERTAEVASACNFSLAELRYHFPCELAPGETADEKLRRLTEEGIQRRYPNGIPQSVRAQIEKELVLIAQLSVAPYFLSTWEVVEIARSKKILCQGRGSAANSAVCYVLGITAVDPARSNLLFERFMSAERSEPPDIDIDFEHERREEVIQELYARHGRDRAAMVSEIICYRGKSALRETGKAFGLSLEQIDRLSNTITHWDSAEVSDSRLVEMGFDPKDTRLRQSVTLARTLEGFPRHLSIHVGGFVLSARPLHEVAPVEPARMPNRTVIPWDKDDIEALGFFKIDVLGLGMLTAIRKCLELIHKDGALHAQPLAADLRIKDEISESEPSCPPSSALETCELDNSYESEPSCPPPLSARRLEEIQECEPSCPPSSVLVASLLRAAGPPQIGRSEAASGGDTRLCSGSLGRPATASCIQGRHASTRASNRAWSQPFRRIPRTHVGLTIWSVCDRPVERFLDSEDSDSDSDSENATGRPEGPKFFGIGASRDNHVFIPSMQSSQRDSAVAEFTRVSADSLDDGRVGVGVTRDGENSATAEFTRVAAGSLLVDVHVGVGVTPDSFELERDVDVSHVKTGGFTVNDSVIAEFTRVGADGLQADTHVGVGITRASFEREGDADVSSVRTERYGSDPSVAEFTRAGAGNLPVAVGVGVGAARESFELDADVSGVRNGSFTRESNGADLAIGEFTRVGADTLPVDAHVGVCTERESFEGDAGADPAIGEFTRVGADGLQADTHVGVGIARERIGQDADVSRVRNGSFTHESGEELVIGEFTRVGAGSSHVTAHVGAGVPRASTGADSTIAEFTRVGADSLQFGARVAGGDSNDAIYSCVTVDETAVCETVSRDDASRNECQRSGRDASESPAHGARSAKREHDVWGGPAARRARSDRAPTRGGNSCSPSDDSVDVSDAALHVTVRVARREWSQVRTSVEQCRFVEKERSRVTLELAEGLELIVRKVRAANEVDVVPETRGEKGEVFDPLEVITRVPAEDPAVYDMACRADTVGVFQIESRAQMSMLPRLKPRNFYDLVVEVAIVRPGPIQGGMVHPYLRRRNGEEAITSPHPDLSPILERTLGVPLFQEQVMQISIVGAGYTGGEADQLRRDMAAWKKSGKLLRHKSRLLEGFAKKGISREFGEALFEQIKGFGDYGFPESHASSFALLVYTSTWQKAHYPAHFACALINSQPMGFYSPSTILQDAQRHGVVVRDVDVSKSEWDCTLEAGALRIGFRLVRGFSEKAAKRLEEARSNAEFSSLDDLARRARLRKNELEMLGEAGALEPLVKGRRNALWQARAPRVEGLFEKTDVSEPKVELPALRAAEQLVLDYGRKGLSVGDHPMKHLRRALRERGVVDAKQLHTIQQGTRVSVAGLVICRQQPGTASGVVFITLEDEMGFVNLVLWNRVYERLRLVARHSTLLLAKGVIDRQTEEVTDPIVHVIVDDLERLDVPGKKLSSHSRDFH